MRSHHTDETTRVMTNVPTPADITVQQFAALYGESPAAFCDGHSSDACHTHPSPDAFADEKPIFLGHSADAGDLRDPRTDSHTVLAGEHPNSQDASQVTDGSSSPATATDSPCAAETSSSTFTSAATPIQTQPPPNPSDTVPPDLPSPSILRAAQSGGAQRRAPFIDDLQALRSNSAQRLQLWESTRVASTSAAFRRFGVELPPSPPALTGDAPNDVFELNKPLQAAMSEFIRRARPTLQEFVELIRGQTGGDHRPNKAILPSALKNYCRGYPKLDIFVRIASEGVRVELIHPLPKQARFPRNHPSAVERINVLRKKIRKELDRWRCLVVDADITEIWPQIFVSPFGVVDKGDGDPRLTGRVIHDLSFPEDWSVNHLTDHTDVAKPTFEHCSSIAREIIRCKRADPGTEVKVMAGDVAAAYRNACIHSEFVHVCAGHIPEDNAIVIDMSAAFGWTGSAGTYSVLGGAVAFIHGSSTDVAYPFGFYNYHWVDDHVNVAADVGSRCADIDRSLRFAMTSVMGHAAVNEDKFTPWNIRQKALGLIFDTVAATVAMPAANILKAQSLVASAIRSATLTRREFRSLLGSLRHVTTCVRPAKAFLQRLRDGERSLHRHT